MTTLQKRSKASVARALTDLQIDDFLTDHGYTIIAGVDEAGRGPLAGPVVAAAVIIPAGMNIPGVDDSKKLTASQREEVFEEIAGSEIPVSVGIIDNRTIDKINILKASLMAMRRAVCGLKNKPQCCLIDGTFEIPNTDIAQMTIVGGDAICKSIGAASIVAKVTRDRIMREYAQIHPRFSFADHFGYPTPAHLAELRKHGPTCIHRRSFRPVARALEERQTPQLAALL